MTISGAKIATTSELLKEMLDTARGQSFDCLANICKCRLDATDNRAPAWVKETLRVVRANKAIPRRSSTLRTA